MLKIIPYLYIASSHSSESESFIEHNTCEFDTIIDRFNNIEFSINIVYADNVFSTQIGAFCEHLINKFFLVNNDFKTPLLIITHENHKEIIEKNHKLFDNSNIWIRYIYYNKDTKSENIKESVKNSISYFLQCNKIALYNQESAREYINYHLRIQKENYLSGSHKAIIPNRYSSEVLRKKEKKTVKKKSKNWRKICIKNIGIRLLLIDDKINCLNDGERHQWTECTKTASDMADINNKICINCKLRIIKELLTKREGFCGFEPIWDTHDVKAYTIGKKEDIVKIQSHNKDIVQIIGVDSIEFAKTIMADKSSKFDLILLDYYFHKDNEENHGTELLEFIDQEQTDEAEILRQDIRQNAGLENRFWIFPITAFPSSFLTHLHSEGVPLLTSKWYIYTPTNPIVMPVRFLYNLNEFVGMMVNRSTYIPSQLITFFKNSLESLRETQWNLDDYISIMRADYRRFLQLYGARLNIYRDKEVSLYAKSIWDKFYSADDIDRRKLITLNHYLRKFYHASAFVIKEREAYEQLRKSWDMLKNHLIYYPDKITSGEIGNFDLKISKFIGSLVSENNKSS